MGGFALGGIGLSIYLRDVIDLGLPLALAIVASMMFGNIGVLAGTPVSALHGYFRVHLSSAPADSESVRAG